MSRPDLRIVPPADYPKPAQFIGVRPVHDQPVDPLFGLEDYAIEEARRSRSLIDRADDWIGQSRYGWDVFALAAGAGCVLLWLGAVWVVGRL